MRQAILFIILLVLLPVSVALQDLLPGIPPAQERLLLLPVVFVFGVIALPMVPALWFALLTALVHGLLLLQVQSGQSEMGLTLPVVFFLGWAILLQMASEATHGMRWELHAIGSALVTLTLLSSEFLVLCIKRGGFPLDFAVLLKIAVPSAAAVLLAPLLYLPLRSLVPFATASDASQLPKKPGFGL
jgi:hypothetical protein